MSGCYVAFHKQLGDLILLEPAISRLLEYHGPPVRLMTRNGHAPVASLMSGVEVVRGAAMAHASALYCFDPLNKSALRSLGAPVSHRHLILPEHAERAWYHRFLFKKLSNPELGNSYVAEFFWQNTPTPSPSPFRPPRLLAPPDDWAPPGWKSGAFVLVNPTSGWKRKMWTAEGWAEVLRSLGNQHFVLTSAAAEWQVAHCREISGMTGAELLTTTMKQFLWLCANARLVLTVDGAASHLAAAFGVPCFTLFGPTSIANWHLPAPGQIALQAPCASDGTRRLKNLPAEPVVAAVKKLAGLS